MHGKFGLLSPGKASSHSTVWQLSHPARDTGTELCAERGRNGPVRQATYVGPTNSLGRLPHRRKNVAATTDTSRQRKTQLATPTRRLVNGRIAPHRRWINRAAQPDQTCSLSRRRRPISFGFSWPRPQVKQRTVKWFTVEWDYINTQSPVHSGEFVSALWCIGRRRVGVAGRRGLAVVFSEVS